jgi:hypothetical protein
VTPLTLDRVQRRLLREYLDLPGLSLSLRQATRLLGVDAPTCRAVLNELVSGGCLAREASGAYVRDDCYHDLETWKRLLQRRLASIAQPSSPMLTGAVTLDRRRPQRSIADGSNRSSHVA